MKINKSELQTALEKVKPGLASKELIEQSTSFAFMGDRVVTYNDEISISHPVKGLEGMNGAVKAKALYEFLSKVTKEEIHIEQEENQVIIKAGKSKAGLVFEQEVRLPVEEIGEIGKWRKLPKDFVEAVKLCHSCCSTDMSRPTLTCVNITKDVVEASDSYQIIQYQLKKKIPSKKGFLIPATSARDLVRYDVQEVSLGESWVHFRTSDDTIFSARIVDEEYPEIAEFLNVKGEEFIFPEEMKEALERAGVFSKKEIDTGTIPAVTVQTKDGEIKLSAKNEYGWFEERLGTKHKDADFSFIIGIEFLNSLFGKMRNCVIDEDKVGFNGENWKHVIAIQANEGK